MGHEISGVLDDGRRVAIEPRNGCGECDQCRQGHFARCRKGFGKAFSHGGFAERIIVPEKSLVDLPPSPPVKDACPVEPLGVEFHVVNRIDPRTGRHVAIIGGGSVGMSRLAVAEQRGCDVTAYVLCDFQREAAEAAGGSAKCLAESDAVIETGGTDSSVAGALDLVAPGGAVCLAGTQNKTTLPFSIYTKEVTLITSFGYCCAKHSGWETASAAQFMAGNPVIAQTLITHRFPLEDFAEAFRVAQDKSARRFKVVIEP